MSGMTSGAEQIERKLDALMDERKQLEKRLEESLRGGGAGGGLAQQLIAKAIDAGGTRFIAAKVDVPDVKALQALGDAVREALGSGVAVLGAALADGKGRSWPWQRTMPVIVGCGPMRWCAMWRRR